MKIIFIGKKTSKPKSIGFTSFIFIIFILLSVNFYIIIYFFDYKKINSNESGSNFKLTSETFGSKQNFNVYVDQIGELHSRILDIDHQTDLLQDVIKKQILGKEKLPKLMKKDKLDSKGGPFNEQKISHNDIQKTLRMLMDGMAIREEIYNKMAITNYSELVKAVVAWSHREGLLTLVPDFITLAEGAMYNNDVQSLKLRPLEATATISTAAQTIALPTDFKSSRSTRLTINYGHLVYATPEALNSTDLIGRPCFFTIIGSNIKFDVIPDQAYSLELVYFKRDLALTAANPTNNVLTNHPSIYLNGALLELFVHALDFDQQQVYRARFYSSIKGANRADKKGRYGNAPAIKVDGGIRP